MNKNVTTLCRPALAIALGYSLVGASECQAAFFDLRGLSPVDGFNYNLTKDGISISVTAHPTQTLRSGATSFGVDSTGTGDSPTLVDGGNGIKEQFDIVFYNKNAFFQSIQISQLDAVDSGTLTVKSGPLIQLANGVTNVGAIPSPTSANTIAWTGDTVSGQGRGFSVDGLTVNFVPEPSTYALLTMSFVGFALNRRRKRSSSCASVENKRKSASARWR
jgi:hypothetical protein